jgi:hypothetical protein
MLIESSESS